MTLDSLMPFEEAIKALQKRGVLPTNLGSAELRQLGAGFHRQNFTSAKTLLTDLLDEYKQSVGEILNPHTVARPDGTLKTEGLDVPTARLRIKELQKQLGFDVSDGSGPITDLRSNARINLVLETNRDVMRGAGHFIQGNDPAVLDAYPAQELVRVIESKARRDWPARFRLAAQATGDVDAARVLAETGRMVARKDSPVWQALGDGAGGYEDTLGNPFAPFAFNSGMDLDDVAYTEALDLGLVRRGEAVRPTLPDDLAELFQAN